MISSIPLSVRHSDQSCEWAQCDGRQPVCSRCEGYSFNCTWSTRRRRASRPSATATTDMLTDGRPCRSPLSPLQDQLPAYSRAVKSYETLIEEIRARLDSSHQAALDFSLQDIRRLVPPEPAENEQVPDSANAVTRVGIATASSPTYVGKASDIHFIQSIRQCVHGHKSDEEVPAQNYSQTYVSESLTALTHPLLFPSQTEADQYLDVYLSTIHVAYPFISRPILLDAFQRFQKGEVHESEFRPWLAIFSTARIFVLSSPRNFSSVFCSLGCFSRGEGRCAFR